MNNEFMGNAKNQWDSIPPQVQEQLIKNVWCPHCSSVTTIADFKGYVEEGNLVLKGKCVKCGGSIVRIIENE
jgi:transcription elongation factor Elf1